MMMAFIFGNVIITILHFCHWLCLKRRNVQEEYLLSCYIVDAYCEVEHWRIGGASESVFWASSRSIKKLPSRVLCRSKVQKQLYFERKIILFITQNGDVSLGVKYQDHQWVPSAEWLCFSDTYLRSWRIGGASETDFGARSRSNKKLYIIVKIR